MRATLRGARRADVFLAVATFAILAINIAADLRSETDRRPDLLAYVIAAVIGTLLLWRRRWPIPVLVASAAITFAYFALEYPVINLAFPVAGALYSAAEQGRTRGAAAVGAGMVALATAYRLIAQDVPAAKVLQADMPPIAVIMAGSIALGYAVRARRLLRDEERRSAETKTRAAQQAAEARIEEERLLLARDLHDVLAHTISVMSIQTDVAIESLEDGNSDAALASLHQVRDQADASIGELRSTVRLLRGEGVREPTVSIADIERLADRASDSGIEVNLRIEPSVHGVQLPVRTTAYRVVQEAVTNTVKHADADHLRIDLRIEPGRAGDSLRIDVADDGRGGPGPAPDGRGHGLRGICERVELVGGTVEYGARNPNGFGVHAVIPL